MFQRACDAGSARVATSCGRALLRVPACGGLLVVLRLRAGGAGAGRVAAAHFGGLAATGFRGGCGGRCGRRWCGCGPIGSSGASGRELPRIPGSDLHVCVITHFWRDTSNSSIVMSSFISFIFGGKSHRPFSGIFLWRDMSSRMCCDRTPFSFVSHRRGAMSRPSYQSAQFCSFHHYHHRHPSSSSSVTAMAAVVAAVIATTPE